MARFESGIVGIDLGTTNTLISYFDERAARGECCANRDGTRMTPSAVYFESGEAYTVGVVARDGAFLYPDNTAMHFKRKMGVLKEAIVVEGKVFSPQQVSALVIKEVLECAREELETEIKEAVITVPAYFSTDARKATIEAGEMAGLLVRDILDEPVAALYHYDAMNEMVGERVLVFDLGGGTLDLMVAEISENEINEIAINGNIHLGGSNWDKVFVEYIKEKYLPGKRLYPDEEQKLLSDAEQAKKILSRKDKTRIVVSTEEGFVGLEVTAKEFDDCTKYLLDEVRSTIKGLMENLFEKGISEFDKIIMVGGATRMRQIDRLLKELFPGTEIITKDPDEAVARGAAVYAKLLSQAADDKRWDVKRNFQPKYLKRISTRSYGLAAILGEHGEKKICNVIFRSEELPITRKQTFYTSREEQKEVNLKVYETISTDRYADIEPGTLLGTCTLEIAEDIPKGAEIEVTFHVSENGVLSLVAFEPRSGKSVKTIMESRALLEVDEIDRQKGDIDKLKKCY